MSDEAGGGRDACHESSGPEETRQLGASLVDRLRPDGILLLEGDMGVGKTVLVQGIAEALGVTDGAVQSPTFTLIHEYPCRDEEIERLVHIDLYRLDPAEVEASGVLDALGDPAAIKVVEWSERLAFDVKPTLVLRIEATGPDTRRFEPS
ncbi:MAG: tRNA (adenosine(37)-N6)-threonylcarbamoyltransferase complex ATPase subunit type 1 TsaE [Acidobacteriota bacterium]